MPSKLWLSRLSAPQLQAPFPHDSAGTPDLQYLPPTQCRSHLAMITACSLVSGAASTSQPLVATDSPVAKRKVLLQLWPSCHSCNNTYRFNTSVWSAAHRKPVRFNNRRVVHACMHHLCVLVSACVVATHCTRSCTAVIAHTLASLHSDSVQLHMVVRRARRAAPELRLASLFYLAR